MSRLIKWPMRLRIWYYMLWAERQNRKWYREHPEIDRMF